MTLAAHPGTDPCASKRSLATRFEALNALAYARRAWAKEPLRAKQPPCRVYQCWTCHKFHLTSRPV